MSDRADREPRQPLSDVGGDDVQWRGDPAFAFPLASAMRAQTAEKRDTLTHGFHAYPARMHPAVAREVLEQLQTGGATVLDPFCGSGTVMLEAMMAGWHSLGSDLNPLALRLARVKTERRNDKSRRAFTKLVRKVADASYRRVEKREPAFARLPKPELRWYEPHVLKEMAGLLTEIRQVKDSKDRRALEMVFSSIVVKVSRQRADTAPVIEDSKRIRKGLATEFFERKGLELADRWGDLSRALPPGSRPPRFVQSDVLRLPHTLSGEFRSQLVLTSPPYGGTYDYVEHHRRRAAWLGISLGPMEKAELGARRDLSGASTGHSKPQKGASKTASKVALKTWDDQVLGYLRVMHELLGPEGVAVLLVGDGEVGGKRVEADAQLERLAPEAGFDFAAVASQTRHDQRGGADRAEHLVALIRP